MNDNLATSSLTPVTVLALDGVPSETAFIPSLLAASALPSQLSLLPPASSGMAGSTDHVTTVAPTDIHMALGADALTGLGDGAPPYSHLLTQTILRPAPPPPAHSPSEAAAPAW